MSYITFEKIQWKNFLSYGDHLENNTFDLNTGCMSLILGHNGAGKSTLLDALCFSLYSKAFRSIKKDQLINSVNGKACEVHLWFSINGVSYKVFRGIKPNKFEIYKNDRLIDPPANVKDYQEQLEAIIGTDFQTFTNMIVIGSSRYAAFMNLSAAQRRGIVSKILDIEIFDYMSQILKGYIATNKEERTHITSEKAVVETKIANDKSNLESLQRDDNVKSVELSLGTEKAEFKDIFNDMNEKQSQVDEAKNEIINISIEEDQTRLTDLRVQKSTEGAQLPRLKKDVEFYQNNDSCNSCGQGIDEEFKKNKIAELKESAKTAMGLVKEADSQIEDLEKIISEKKEKLDEVTKLENELNIIKSNLKNKKESIQHFERILKESQSNNNEKIEEIQNLLEEHQKEFDKFLETSEELDEMIAVFDVIKMFLKDSGIKAEVIREWLPSLNKQINIVLDSLGAHYSFELDEAFNETIRSRYRDKFSYESFSEGEKTRIDTAILFAFREVAKDKATVNCNLLIMDEILDGSLDAEATEILLNLLSEQDQSIYIVSHKVESINYFPRYITIEKRGNFSEIVDIVSGSL